MRGTDARLTPAGEIALDPLPLERLYRWERERPDAAFLTQPLGGQVREWTWGQAAAEVRRIAGYLKSQDWEPGTRVAILSKNCAWWVMADLAIWMAGHVTVPVYPSLRAATARQILEHSDSKACFLGAADDSETARYAIPDGLLTIRMPTAASGAGPDWESIAAQNRPLTDDPARSADDLATIFYTSGTTGAPKGAMHGFAALSYLTQTLGHRLDLAGEQRVFSYLPLAHIFERGALEVPAVLLGWHIFFAQRLETFMTDLRRARPTLFYSVPRLLLKMQQGVFESISRHRLEMLLGCPLAGRVVARRILNRLGLGTVRYAACGSAPTPPEVLLWYRRLGLNLIEGYGLTEGLITHLAKPGSLRPGYVGHALDGVETRLGDNGELLVRSPMNMLGYYKDPQATRDAFTEDGFLRTGDLAEVAGDGQVRIVGRLKEQFKTSKGKYVVPAPIEIRLASHADVEACCLMGAGLSKPFAVVVLSPDARLRCAGLSARRALEQSLGELLAGVNAELDPHERLLFLAVAAEPWTVSNGLVTPTLKLRRSVLEQRYRAYFDLWSQQSRPVVWEPGEPG